MIGHANKRPIMIYELTKIQKHALREAKIKKITVRKINKNFNK